MIINEWNNTRTDYPQGKTIADLFEEQVEKTPESIAVAYKDKRISYRELNEKANRLANYLIKECGVVADDIVALCLDRSELIIISILGVLKSGAAYAPMNPDYPKERLEYIINDTKAKAVITKDAFNEKVEGESAENPVRKINPNNLAYVIYTSGTTGQPKGVMVEHRGLVNLIVDQAKTFGISGDEWDGKVKNCLWFSTYVFDAHAWEIFITLIFGHQLHIAAKELRTDIELLGEFIRKNKISFGHVTPALLDAENMLPLETLLVGGETANSVLLDKYAKAGIRVVNAYGPTETTVIATFHYYEAGDSNRNIGRPIANTTTYILDNKMRQVPVGAVGELHIGGDGVARGYLNKPELTAEKFVTNPFQTEEEKESGFNGRLYKTGDLVKYLPDGNIEFLGRNDFQVKIRGFRIELGEIENAISGCAGVKQCVAVAKEKGGNKYLAAYYVGKVEVGELRKYLFDKLLEYMVPAVFVKLEQLPLTVNGKIDRRALPEPNAYGEVESYEAPANERESELVKIFAKALGMEAEKLSATEDFFRLGGSSITAIKLANRIQREMGLNLKVSDIFEHKTVREIAKQADLQRLKIIRREFKRPEDQKLSYAQGRMWFMEKYDGGSNAYNVPVIAKKIKKGISIQNIKQAINEIVRRHETLRSVIKSDAEGDGYQETLNWHEKLLEMPEERLKNANELESAITKDFNYIFNLESELPIKVKFYEVDGKQYLSMVTHHIAFDGWSQDIFMRELSKLHDYYQNGGEYPLKELAIRYKDYAVWQREYLQGEVLTKQLDYWKQKLADCETLNLPTDKERPARQQYNGGNANFKFDEETSKRLRAIAKDIGVSAYSVMLSAYYLLLSTYSGQKNIVVGAFTANRGYEEISDIIGFFVNTIVMREEVDVDADIGEFIARVGNSAREAQLYQDTPFEMLVSALGIHPSGNRNPIFQVAFSFQTVDGKEANELFEPLDTTRNENMYSVAKFDLTLDINDDGKIMNGNFGYALSLFTPETINSYIETFTEIINQITQAVKEA